VIPKHIKLHTYFNALKQITKELALIDEEVQKRGLIYILQMKNTRKKTKVLKRSPRVRFKSRSIDHKFFSRTKLVIYVILNKQGRLAHFLFSPSVVCD